MVRAGVRQAVAPNDEIYGRGYEKHAAHGNAGDMRRRSHRTHYGIRIVANSSRGDLTPYARVLAMDRLRSTYSSRQLAMGRKILQTLRL